jgi:Uri superfamily endonuclease
VDTVDRIREIVPARSGCYVLVLFLQQRHQLTVGRRAAGEFSPGYYLYVGSAFGPGGLRARLGRHVSGSGRRHWHVDYLRAVAAPVEAWFQIQAVSGEHEWAECLGRGRGLRPVAGFGASDCGCLSHLYQSTALPGCAAFRARLPRGESPALPVRRIRLQPQP